MSVRAWGQSVGNTPNVTCGSKTVVVPRFSASVPRFRPTLPAEFAYRANRRWGEARLFDRLLVAAVSAKVMTYKQLVTGGS